MTVPAYVKFNSRERALSTDQNRQAILSRRALAEAMAALSTGTLKQSGCFGASFVVAPQAGTMKCSITPGIALMRDDTAVFPYSSVSWIESSVLREVTLDVGDGNPRYDVVEMRAGSATTLTQPRDEFNPLTGSFSVVNMAKEVASYPEFQVRKGTAAVAPTIPEGVAGWMPLAYVAVPGGAIQLIADNVVHCRPILDAQPGKGWTDPALVLHATGIKGGGMSVSAGNAITTSLRTTGRFPGHHHDFRIDAGAGAGFGSLVWDGGGAPVASGPMYFYAIPAPYPAGYDASMAPREFWTPDATVVYGAGSGFEDADLQEGCLIIASTATPELTHESGYSTGTATFNHTFFDSGSATSARFSWVYLGAASYDHTVTQCTQQLTAGASVATKRKPGHDFLAAMPIVGDTVINLRSEVTIGVVRWPITARSIDCHLFSNIGAGGNLAFLATDDDAGSTSPQGWHAYQFSNPEAGSVFHSVIVPMRLNASGQITIKAAAHSGATVTRLFAVRYKDEVLAIRMS